MNPDIDIDCKDRNLLLDHFEHIPASMFKNNKIKKHNTGVYFQSVPVDPLTGYCSLDYKTANERNYFKIDLLNVHIYEDIENEDHLDKLLNQEPLWDILLEWEIVEQLFQINSPYTFEVIKNKPPRSIDDLAILIAVIRPPMKHLINYQYREIEKHIWNISEEQKQQGAFRKAHAYAYAHALVVQMNRLVEMS